jgi:hypothetical protein
MLQFINRNTAKLIFLIAICMGLSTCKNTNVVRVVILKSASDLEVLAAKEVSRYFYLRTGYLPEIKSADDFESISGNLIVVSVADKSGFKIKTHNNSQVLKNQEYQIETINNPKGKTLLILGGDDVGTLYGAYRFAELLGCRFYLHGDVIPDEKIKPELPTLSAFGSPAFELRGILPFHDFPEGPDWWNLNEYKTVISQLPKLRMNFIGFHTYPEIKNFYGGPKAEPLTWHGLPENVNADGSVKTGYPVLHSYTRDTTWGYHRKKTGDFCCGASQLFEKDYYGADYILGISDWPHTNEENIRLFNEVGAMLDESFSLAKALGVKTCLGTEVPLTVPDKIIEELKAQGRPVDDQAIKDIYKGTFERITKRHPLDYYWFWTPERWTWRLADRDRIKKTVDDLLLAVEAHQEVNPPFTLATSGWVLGPPTGIEEFDAQLPTEMPFSCINREMGYTLVDTNFKLIQNRPKWAIPWLEDDPALTSPQLWAGRMMRDAKDALDYGCNGLMGIHWRTRVLSPNIASLASIAWEKDFLESAQIEDGERDLPPYDFYLDWARVEFGSQIGEQMAGIFVRLDGGPLYTDVQDRKRNANMPRPTWWSTGPGAIWIDPLPWEEVKMDYSFIDEIAKLEPLIRGKGNRERFKYWLNTFLLAKKQAELGCKLGEMDTLVKQLEILPETRKKDFANQEIIPRRIAATRLFEDMMDIQLSLVSNTGEMGTIANFELHNLAKINILGRHDSIIEAANGEKLPPEIEFRKTYNGKLLIINTAPLGIMKSGEDYYLRLRVLSQQPVEELQLHFKALGAKNFKTEDLSHINRGVYEITFTQNEFSDQDFEYYITAKTKTETAIWPATAPEICQSVVVWGGREVRGEK